MTVHRNVLCPQCNILNHHFRDTSENQPTNKPTDRDETKSKPEPEPQRQSKTRYDENSYCIS